MEAMNRFLEVLRRMLMVVVWVSVAALVPHIVSWGDAMPQDPVVTFVLVMAAPGYAFALMQLVNWIFSAGRFADDGKPKKPK